MTSPPDPSFALASILAVLSQSVQRQEKQNSRIISPSLIPTQIQEIEPVFTDGRDILDTSQWMGVPAIQWHEPRRWQLPHSTRLEGYSDPARPLKKRRRSDIYDGTSIEHPLTPTTQIRSFPSFTAALKHVFGLSESTGLVEKLQKMARRQNDIEADLFEQRSVLTQKWESKRKMNQLLHSLGSDGTDEKV
jgi:hypothetical protein